MLKKVSLILLVFIFVSGCATKYTFDSNYETDRKEQLMKLAKTSKNTYDYATKIYKDGYYKDIEKKAVRTMDGHLIKEINAEDYEIIVIETQSADKFFKGLIVKDFAYYCESIDGFMEGFTPYTGRAIFIKKYEPQDSKHHVCYNKETRDEIFSVRSTFECDQIVGTHQTSRTSFLDKMVEPENPKTCLMRVKTEEYYNKLRNETRRTR